MGKVQRACREVAFYVRPMHWLNIEITRTQGPEYTSAEPAQQLAWFHLLLYCAQQENGGIIHGASTFSDRQWQRLIDVDGSTIRSGCALWSFTEDGDLIVWQYPVKQEQVVQAKRDGGRKGGETKAQNRRTPSGTPCRTPTSTPTGSPSGTPSTKEEEEEKVEEKKEEEQKEEVSAPVLPASPPETVTEVPLELFADQSPPSPPNPRQRKPKPTAEFQPPKDSRHREITSQIKEIYEGHARMPYVNNPRFYKRLQVFLSNWHGDSELFLSLYEKALTLCDREYSPKEIRLASDPVYLCDNFQKVVAAVDWVQAGIDRESKPKTFTKGI